VPLEPPVITTRGRASARHRLSGPLWLDCAVASLHQVGRRWHGASRANVASCERDHAKRSAFTEACEALSNGLDAGEALWFAAAVHPTHSALFIAL